MASIAKQILGAFLEIQDSVKAGNETKDVEENNYASSEAKIYTMAVATTVSDKFKHYFDKLFNEANLPGPDYYEFAKMTEAMKILPDERTRYVTAYAGLSVQGLTLLQLLYSAEEYVKILDADAAQFSITINDAIKEKVSAKKQLLQEKTQQIEVLKKEINDLTVSIASVGNEINENEEKIRESENGYAFELNATKTKIENDISKIKQYIQ